MILSLTTSNEELDRLLAGAKAQYPALALLAQVRLEPGLGLRVHLDSPAGPVEALVKLETKTG